ncbi:hypothetical protein T01_15068 [Trichinella spiralis]|uniref:Uncharacterized protein n=1 Tax=Trichinella spiralis TaxID=6334 RepID=A0A0V1B403_TRISP|nr:hypothetical protein T01_15068 [Trichinella spiralis]
MAFNCLNFKTTLAWLIWQSRTTTIETSTSSDHGKLGEDSKRGTFSKIYTTGKMNNFPHSFLKYFENYIQINMRFSNVSEIVHLLTNFS